jgi:hypothetical protein
MEDIEAAGLIRTYEVKGKRYFELQEFYERCGETRSKTSKFPAPPFFDDSLFIRPGQSAKRAQSTSIADAQRARTETETDSETKTETETETESWSECAEPREDARSTPVDLPLVEFPCDGSPRRWALTPSIAQELHEAFPSQDILGEARKALAWVRASPERRKTARGMRRFLTGWIGRAQDAPRAGPMGHGGAVRTEPAAFAGIREYIRQSGLLEDNDGDAPRSVDSLGRSIEGVPQLPPSRRVR